jgi:hypothetical protein
VIWRVALPQAERRRGVAGFVGPILAGGRLIVGSTDNGLLQFDPASGAALGAVPLPAARPRPLSWQAPRSTSSPRMGVSTPSVEGAT